MHRNPGWLLRLLMVMVAVVLLSPSTSAKALDHQGTIVVKRLDHNVIPPEGVEGRTFKATLLTPSFVAEAENLTAPQMLQRALSSLSQRAWTATTNDRGDAVFTSMPRGWYLIQETSASGPLATPAIVQLPGTTKEPGQDPWFVEVYSKVTAATITKTVADGNLGVAHEDAPVAGNHLTYTLRSTIPAGGLRAFGGRCMKGSQVASGVGLDPQGFTANGECPPQSTYVGPSDQDGAYVVVDELPPETRPYLSWITTQDQAKASLGGQPLKGCMKPQEACDYRVTATKDRVEVYLLEPGLVKLAQARSQRMDATLEVRLKGVLLPAVESLPPGSVLSFANTALLYSSKTPWKKKTPVTSNTTQTRYSSFKLMKLDGDDRRPLPGATFAVYRTQANAEDEVHPLITAITNEEGEALFQGLHVTDYQNDGEGHDSYWVKELTAPKGYQRDLHLREVRLLSSGGVEGANAQGFLEFLNFKTTADGGTNDAPQGTSHVTTPPAIPSSFTEGLKAVVEKVPGLVQSGELSPSAVRWLLVIGGLLLVVGGGYLAWRRSSRKVKG